MNQTFNISKIDMDNLIVSIFTTCRFKRHQFISINHFKKRMPKYYAAAANK